MSYSRTNITCRPVCGRLRSLSVTGDLISQQQVSIWPGKPGTLTPLAWNSAETRSDLRNVTQAPNHHQTPPSSRPHGRATRAAWYTRQIPRASTMYMSGVYGVVKERWQARQDADSTQTAWDFFRARGCKVRPPRIRACPRSRLCERCPGPKPGTVRPRALATWAREH